MVGDDYPRKSALQEPMQLVLSEATPKPEPAMATHGDPNPYPIKETGEIRKRLNFISDISRRVGSSQELSRLIEQIAQLSRNALSAAASAVLLLDNEGLLVVEAANDPAGKPSMRVRLDERSGIAGWVAYHNEPATVHEAFKDPRFNASIDRVGGFETRSVACAPLVVEGKVIGVIEVLNKLDERNFDDHDLKTLVSAAACAATALNGTRASQDMSASYKSTVKALAAAVDAKDPYACGHSQRVLEYVLLGLSSVALSREEKEVIEYAAVLHDIGKAYLPDRILLKPGPFTAAEWKVIRKHPTIGYTMLRSTPFLEKPSRLVLYHHERYDGNGYPNGLKGDAIPFGARLIAVADAFDTMTTCHLYRAACSVDYAIEKLRKSAGIQFCPTAARVFVSSFAKFHFPETD